MGLFTRIVSLLPSNTPPEIVSTYKKIFEGLSNAKTPEELKEFVIDVLRDPKNAEFVNGLKNTLDAALKTPGIEKLVKIATDPNIIQSASNVLNSGAGKNFAKVIADKESSRAGIVAAGVRLAATAIPKLLYHSVSLVKAGLIAQKMSEIEHKANEGARREAELQRSMDDGISRIGASEEESAQIRSGIAEMRNIAATRQKENTSGASFDMKKREGNISYGMTNSRVYFSGNGASVAIEHKAANNVSPNATPNVSGGSRAKGNHR